ncbi:MAG: carbamate kinase [Planctomycetaceae bacterium]|nr:carbamate kinase [Planctomycetaceae bacterium]
MPPESVLVALGGHALVRPGREASVEEEVEAIREAAAAVVEMVREGRRVVVTHGNGPQVGHALARSEAGRGKAYPLPLDVCVAQTQGEIGYLLQQGVSEGLRAAGLDREVVSVVTRILVDGSSRSAAKPVGPVLEPGEADRLRAEGVRIVADRKRGLRRAVPSPEPLRILEEGAVRLLHGAGIVVIAAGGGGIPVRELKDGSLRGVPAVVDKDLASALLASALDVDVLLDLTSVECVRLNFGTLLEAPVRELTVAAARRHLAEGQFPEGTMGPKIEAAVRFLERGGRRAVITDPPHAAAGLRGEAGTRILPRTTEERP